MHGVKVLDAQIKELSALSCVGRRVDSGLPLCPSPLHCNPNSAFKWEKDTEVVKNLNAN